LVSIGILRRIIGKISVVDMVVITPTMAFVREVYPSGKSQSFQFRRLLPDWNHAEG